MGRVSDFYEHDLDLIEDMEQFGPDRDATPVSSAALSRRLARQSQQCKPQDSKGDSHEVRPPKVL